MLRTWWFPVAAALAVLFAGVRAHSSEQAHPPQRVLTPSRTVTLSTGATFITVSAQAKVSTGVDLPNAGVGSSQPARSRCVRQLWSAVRAAETSGLRRVARRSAGGHTLTIDGVSYVATGRQGRWALTHLAPRFARMTWPECQANRSTPA